MMQPADRTVDRTADRTVDGPADPLAARAEQMAAAVLDCTLAKPEWTHEAHLFVCVALVRRHGAAGALDILRTAIPRYNEATGVANTMSGGYHDTLTVYYVWAISALLAAGVGIEQILVDPTVSRAAPLAWWDASTLFSPRARAAWLAPGQGPPGDDVPTDQLSPRPLI